MLYRFLLISTTSLLLLCDKEQSTVKEPLFKLNRFAQPLNDSISNDQATGWRKSNPALDSLSKLYIDSFATEDANLRIRYQSDFKNRQDTICAFNGLNGGYDEYMWILKNSGKPENKHLFK